MSRRKAVNGHGARMLPEVHDRKSVDLGLKKKKTVALMPKGCWGQNNVEEKNRKYWNALSLQ